MFLTLLNIVLPVVAVAGLGYWFGRRQAKPPQMEFINHANVTVFCPAMVFSALLDNPVNVLDAWPLVVAGSLIILLPGVLLLLIPHPTKTREAFLASGMFRNTGNIGIPLMMLAYGKDQMGGIILLFVLSNLFQFSIGLMLLSHGRGVWEWARNPNIWGAVLGLALAPLHDHLPPFFTTSVDLVGQITIPLMLFSLGVRLSMDRIEQLGLAFKINCLYLLAGLLSLPIIWWMLPLTPEWMRLVAFCAMLPPAVLNYLLSEQYDVEPRLVANVVMLGNVMSVATMPLVVWATLTWI